jgi:hypothetical protein
MIGTWVQGRLHAARAAIGGPNLYYNQYRANIAAAYSPIVAEPRAKGYDEPDLLGLTRTLVACKL